MSFFLLLIEYSILCYFNPSCIYLFFQLCVFISSIYVPVHIVYINSYMTMSFARLKINRQTFYYFLSVAIRGRFFKIKVEAVFRKNRWSLLYSYSTVYKLCALVDIQKTLMFLCCVPYLQISGSHAITIVLRLRTKLLKQVK